MKRIFTLNDPWPHLPRRYQKGSIMVLTTVMILVMVGILALAVDLGFLFSARNQLQNGIDAAALAAGAGLRVTIEADSSAPQQRIIAQQLAIQYAGYNQLRRYPDPDPNANQPNANNITISAGDVTVDTNGELPKVRVTTSKEVPLLFAGVFGFNNINMGATATASLLPVDGGTGTIGSGTSIGGGCWRPLLLPDTFYDSSERVVMIGPDASGVPRLPNQIGDYYRSRFAAGARNTYPFVDYFSGGPGPSVTGLRDTQSQAEIGTATIMGQQPVIFSPTYYFIANFSALPRSTYDVLSVGDLANFGYCGKIRVGDDIPVYPRNDPAYDQVRIGLLALQYRTIGVDTIDTVTKSMFRYVTSSTYPGPNTHGAIIPVLLYNPLIWKDPGIL
jgi:Predicted membrane protein